LGEIGDEHYFLACFDFKTRIICENGVVVIRRNFLVPKYLLTVRTVNKHYAPNKVKFGYLLRKNCGYLMTHTQIYLEKLKI
jgi:hypothetical protein